MAPERRKTKRHPVLVSVDFQCKGAKHEGRISDLSEEGMFIDTKYTYNPGQDIEVGFSLDQNIGRLNLRGQITWAQPGVGMGLRFTNCPEPVKRQLTQYVRRLG